MRSRARRRPARVSAGQSKPAGIARRLVVRRLRPLVRHLQEEQVGELLDVVAVGQAVVAQDVAVVPELLDDLLGMIGRHSDIGMANGKEVSCSQTEVSLSRVGRERGWCTGIAVASRPRPGGSYAGSGWKRREHLLFAAEVAPRLGMGDAGLAGHPPNHA